MGGAHIERVAAGMPLEKTGLRPGDTIVAVNGQKIRSAHDWFEMAWQFAPETPIVVSAIRNGRELLFTMRMSPLRMWQTLGGRQWLDSLSNATLALAYIACGLAVLFGRPRHSGAVAGAILLLVLGTFLSLVLDSSGIAVLFRRMPFPLQLPVYFVHILVGGYLVLLFSALFPRAVFRRRWVLPALLVPGLALIANNAVRLFHRFYMPSRAIAPGPPWTFRLQLFVEMAYIVAGLIVVGLGYRRLRDPDARRRARRIFGAAVASFTALLVYFWLLSMTGSRLLGAVFSFPATGFVFLILWSFFPAVFAYTVLSEKSPAVGVAASAESSG